MTTTPRHMSMKGRLRAAFLLLAAIGGSAWAQTDVTPPTPAQALSCLQRGTAPAYPQRHDYDRDRGFMRVRLQFSHADRPPRVEILVNTAREDMQTVVLRYLDSYRLPCWREQDGMVAAVQEFSFNNASDAESPVPEEVPGEGPSCLVIPREDMQLWLIKAKPMEHVVVAATFAGAGDQRPEVKLLHSSGNTAFEDAVRRRVWEYRMPCRQAGDGARVIQQQFSYVSPQHRRMVFTQDLFSLKAFLGMTQDIASVKARFDFSTMNCPFTLSYTNYGPTLPNEVKPVGPSDPNRLLFIKWLAERQLAFSSAQQASDLFGTRVLIQVPCGQLDLGEKRGDSAT